MNYKQEEVQTMVDISTQVIDLLKEMEPAVSLAVVNYTFLKMVLTFTEDRVSASSMSAAFTRNIMNSIYEYYDSQENEGDPVH